MSATGSLGLLAEAAAASGFQVVVSPNGLRLRRPGLAGLLRWPPRPDPSKLILPRLIRNSRVLQACPTRLLHTMADPPWLPGCIKASRGSNGKGFHAFHDRRGWKQALRVRARLDAPMVVQPLLSGSEYRITVTATGEFAIAQLAARKGARTLWTDHSESADARLLDDLYALLHSLRTPVVGVDVILTAQRWVLLDVNLGPSLGVHLVTDRPRNLAPAVLASWMAQRAASLA